MIFLGISSVKRSICWPGIRVDMAGMAVMNRLDVVVNVSRILIGPNTSFALFRGNFP